MEPTTTPIQTTPGASGKMSPKFFFLSLGVIISLITSVTAFLNLAFATLDFKFPDVLNSTYQYGYNSFNFDATRSYIAILIIFLPICMVLMYYYKRVVRAGLGKTEEIIRKWSSYLIVFLAIVVAAIDLVTLVQYFVGGEITTRFILKVLATLVAAKWSGLYFYFDLHESKWKKITERVVPWGTAILSVGLIVLSFMVIGTPNEQRTWRLDDRRVNDLTSLQSQVISYWQQKEKLPATLTDLTNPTSYYAIPVDPEFEKGLTYEYTVTGKLSFELCATFSAKMPKGWQEYSGGGVMPMYETRTDVATSPVSYPYPGGTMGQSWDHEAGRTCFTRTIDTDVYKPYKPSPVGLTIATPAKQ